MFPVLNPSAGDAFSGAIFDQKHIKSRKTMNSMIWENWVPFKQNKREALIKQMVLKRLGDEIRPISYQKFVFLMPERRSGRPDRRSGRPERGSVPPERCSGGA